MSARFLFWKTVLCFFVINKHFVDSWDCVNIPFLIKFALTNISTYCSFLAELSIILVVAK